MATRQRKSKANPAKVVWRISATAPLGEYVHTDDPTHTAPRSEPGLESVIGDLPTEIPERGWHHSSHELVRGMDLSEEPLDTLPDDLFDHFFKKQT